MLASDTSNATIPSRLPSEHGMLIAVNWLIAPLPFAAAYFLNDHALWWVFALTGLGLGVCVKLAEKLPAALRDYVISFCFIGHCISLTSALTGHPLQIDSHMLFFAALAIVSTLSNPRALLFATALVALHHISLSVLVPKLVYPGGNTADNLYRTAVHAGIILLESGVLLLSLLKRAAAETALEQEHAALQEQTEIAQQSRARAKENKENADLMAATLRRHLEELSQGKMDCRISSDFPDEYIDLRNSFNSTTEKLNDTLGQVSMAAASIKDSISGMSNSSEDLSQRSEDQAATLEEAAAALEEMTVSVSQSTEGTRDARETASSARNEAEEIRVIVKDAVTAMKDIEGSSTKMSDIIGVIDDIAFQTNLLALNAGVEAARAGDAGRGFAVVATEVRGLAHRSAESATEIKVLIEQSSQQVRNGVEFVDKAGDAINRIVERVNEISAAISGIAAASEEQSLGLTEINSGVSALDGVTQSNAELAGALLSSGRDLNEQAEQLDRLMRQFDLTSTFTPKRLEAA